MPQDAGEIFLRQAIEQLASYQRLGERALAQVYDRGLHVRLDPGSNTIAELVKHLAGNMRSRWTGFLTSDGEKPDRNRDAEFQVEPDVPRGVIFEWWADGWARVFESLHALRPEDLERTVTIRGQPLTVAEAILRALAHYAYHVGQIVFLAKHLAGDNWKTLSIPRRSRA
jgi:hypothetical protein